MTISLIHIHHFRNIELAKLEFSPNFNFIVGNNGSGKTSLLEALYMLGHGRAFRHIQSNRIIQYDKPELVLFSSVNRSENQVISIGLAKSRSNENKIKINGDEGFKLTDLAKLIPMQLITPEGFDLLIGGPKYRRAFIDWGCFHHYPEFAAIWNNLKRLFKQRNAQLKYANTYQELIHWDKEIIPLAVKISHIRQAYATNIFPEIIQTSALFLPEYTLDCHFYPGWEPDTDYQETLIHNFTRDKLLNYTHAGPHKADLKLKANTVAVEDSLSRGQLKLLMCALRLSQGDFYTKETGHPCIYLIDDFTSELDSTKRDLLASRLKATQSQVFITSVNQSQIMGLVGENDKIFHIQSGIIVP